MGEPAVSGPGALRLRRLGVPYDSELVRKQLELHSPDVTYSVSKDYRGSPTDSGLSPELCLPFADSLVLPDPGDHAALPLGQVVELGFVQGEVCPA